MLTTYVWIAVGGAIGSMARFACAQAAPIDRFPWGTLIVNVIGSAIIGALAGLLGPQGRWPSESMRAFLMVGVCGGFTTFSAFSLQTLGLIQAGDMARAGLNVIGSVTLCLLAVWAGQAAGVALGAR